MAVKQIHIDNVNEVGSGITYTDANASTSPTLYVFQLIADGMDSISLGGMRVLFGESLVLDGYIAVDANGQKIHKTLSFNLSGSSNRTYSTTYADITVATNDGVPQVTAAILEGVEGDQVSGEIATFFAETLKISLGTLDSIVMVQVDDESPTYIGSDQSKNSWSDVQSDILNHVTPNDWGNVTFDWGNVTFNDLRGLTVTFTVTNLHQAIKLIIE